MNNISKCYTRRTFTGSFFAFTWEQRELRELGSVAMNKRIFKDQTTVSGDVPFYKIGTFGSSPDAYITRNLFEEYKSKYPYPEIGDILISASGSIGRTVEYKGKDEYFQDSNIVWLKHNDEVENLFLKHFYSVVKWSGLEGSTIQRLYNKNILDTHIKLPDIEEQKRVGGFLDNLDNLITLHQRKYEKLVNIKKALLKKMFV
jgi:type I restriction enzyme S subunit